MHKFFFSFTPFFVNTTVYNVYQNKIIFLRTCNYKKYRISDVEGGVNLTKKTRMIKESHKTCYGYKYGV